MLLFIIFCISDASSDVWIGLQRDNVDAPWEWIRNGRHPGPDKQGDWGPEDPNGTEGDLCVRAMKHAKFLVGDRVCSSALIYVCEIWQ